MKKVLVLVAAAAILGLNVGSASAQLEDVKVGLHAGGPSAAKNACTSGDAALLPGCNAEVGSALTVTTDAAGQFYTYIFLMDINPSAGLNAIEFALDFDNGTPGVYIYGAGNTLCGDAEFSAANWPSQPNQGATITWSGCVNTVDANDPQNEAMIMAYILKCYGYSAGSANDLCVVIKPSNVFGASTCTSTFVDLKPNFPDNAGCIGVAGAAGYDPCGVGTPVEESTWGGIKSQFSKSED